MSKLKPLSRDWFQELGYKASDIQGLASTSYADRIGHARAIARVAGRIVIDVHLALEAEPGWDANGAPV